MSESNSTHQFPSPIGGVPLPIDLVPSVIFCVLYAAVFSLMTYRIVRRHSRTFVTIGTLFFCLERYSCRLRIRAVASQHPGLRNNLKFLTYLQTSLAGGFLTVGGDVTNLIRALLVGSTLGSDMLPLHPKLTPAHARAGAAPARSSSTFLSAHPGANPEGPAHELQARGGDAGSWGTASLDEALADHPRMRFWLRQACGATALLFLGGVGLAIVAGVNFKHAVLTGERSTLIRVAWCVYGSAALALALLSWIHLVLCWALFRLPRVPTRSVAWSLLITSLLLLTCIYRIDVLKCSTTALDATGRCSNNSPVEKALFWLFHVGAEFGAVAVLVSLNSVKTFGSGLWGDVKNTDPKPEPPRESTATEA
ncbi:uncharacterized protein BXZ73DRAFT_41338 [Epithele typhae]|uniref:uncharacterized protein n=1 Tax=Epithele typhae TaxID=378194 RepID=UPI002007B024|nr:uncharacterized protein BXZ73DRAFT_41338 [Epithele typhae]KAH9942143.1 hypothetical protein BXZ73DRAFT_41338 [Epithele typhae]